MSREGRVTLIRPPPPDPNKAPIESVLEVTELAVLGPDIYTNTRQPWLPPNARGIFGGAVIAQCLAAAFKTVAEGFVAHSCHCYFLLAGSSSIPILFHVERVREGRSFATRTVQARQKGRCIFTTTISFVRTGSGGFNPVHHAAALPEGVVPPPEGDWDEEPMANRTSPIQNMPIEMVRAKDPTARLDERKCRQWSRVRGKISEEGGTQAHLNALSYMSDSFFIGTVARIHGLWRFPFRPEEMASLPEKQRSKVEAILKVEGLEDATVEELSARPTLGMLVSLDHSIYFHEPLRVRADEWMFTEMESPWAGDGRGVVTQRIFARDGTLLATCMQEGVIRLEEPKKEAKEAKL
ncbi:acyl-CoA thioesterase II [Stachybotrys elegans]|uniref:Acyl-CoA thioesterase II n=1 Tax=Stachybotrys elegans TaxID=80388 RepID=A0A8K0SUJ2_9HYPO|nr:acyl-CoA thioesterase II [Stachybotrys elegans]